MENDPAVSGTVQCRTIFKQSVETRVGPTRQWLEIRFIRLGATCQREHPSPHHTKISNGARTNLVCAPVCGNPCLRVLVPCRRCVVLCCVVLFCFVLCCVVGDSGRIFPPVAADEATGINEAVVVIVVVGAVNRIPFKSHLGQYKRLYESVVHLPHRSS